MNGQAPSNTVPGGAGGVTLEKTQGAQRTSYEIVRDALENDTTRLLKYNMFASANDNEEPKNAQSILGRFWSYLNSEINIQ